MNLCVLNDWHLGCVRTGGTTPATAYKLRLDLLQQFEDILDGIDSDLLVNGDLFDGPDISKSDLLRAYKALSGWLGRSGRSLWLSNGNHDLSKRSDNFSSFQLLAALLVEEGAYPGTVTHIEGAGQMTPHGYVIPHVANQDLFNLELAKVPECDYLFVHCNYDNEFSVEADHSLNMSREQAEALPVKHIVFGHEHQAKVALGGKVVIVGNQKPSSVSDCLGNDDKEVFQVLADGSYGLSTCWQAAGDFTELPWQEINGYEGPERFIRVTGTAAADQAATVVQAISRFRAASSALVITNAVKIEGVDDAAELALSHEEVTSFNVAAALSELLTPAENAKLAELEKKHAA